MIKKALVIFLLFATNLLNGQISVTSGTMTPAQYVQNVLIGSGVSVSNVTYVGQQEQLGFFSNGNSAAPSLGLDSGIVISSGSVLDIPPGGNQPDQGDYSNPGDADLLSIAQSVTSNPDAGMINSTGDAAILEFDFIPTGDTVEFRFVFASEEYTTFINSQYNDIFAFFVSGPGITGPFSSPGGFPNGAINVAQVPGTNDPITISSIHPGLNNQYYIDNTTEANNDFNGFTTTMTIKFYTQCGSTYHFKIAIADCQDTYLDTGVFLEAGSFSSNTVTLSSSVDVANGDSLLYEGCGTAYLDFVRSDDTDTSVYYYNIYGDATNSDYIVSADSIVFLPGQSNLTLSFNAISDGITEPYEQVNIEMIQTVCGVTDTTTVTFYIADFPEPVIIGHDTSISCLTDSVPIWIDQTNGVNVLWETGETSDTIWVTPISTSYFTVQVSDTCGLFTVTDSVLVTYINPSPILVTAPDSIGKYCAQDSLLLYASATGGAGVGSFTFNWMPIGVQSDSLLVSPDTTTTYIVTATDVCGNTQTDSVLVFVPQFFPLFVDVATLDTTICEGLTVTLNAQVSGGVGTYYTWNKGLGSVLQTDVTPNITTAYILTGQDSCGAIAKDSVVITVDVSGIQVNIPDQSINCFNELVTLDASVSNNIGVVSFDWSTGEITDTIVVSPLVTSTYWVEVKDLCKTVYDTIVVSAPVFAPLNIINTGTQLIDCPGDLAVLSALVSGGDTAAQFFNWSDGANNYVGNNVSVYPDSTTVYSFVVTDTCAFMSDSISVTVNIPAYAPLSTQITNDTIICRGQEIKLGVLAQGGAGGYTYDWKGLGDTDSITVQINEYSTFNVNVFDKCNNYVSADVNIDEMHPNANFGYEYLTDYTVEFYDSSKTDIIYHLWTFEFQDTSNALNPVYTYLTQGEHSVNLFVRDIKGCTDDTSIIIKPNIYFYVPNSFTPNGDNLNDVFEVKGMGIEKFEMYIFNRWGNEIFYTDNVEKSWDGFYKGSLVKNDSYVYLIKAVNYDGEEIQQRGLVNVLR